MSGIKLLPPFVLLVAGFLLCHSIPSWRRYVIRANGQQLTLRSAIAGFGAALPVFAVLYLLHAFSAPSASPYANPDPRSEPSPDTTMGPEGPIVVTLAYSRASRAF